MGNLTAALSGLSKLNGIKGAFILGEAGKILESFNPENSNHEELIRVSLSAFESSRRTGLLLKKGEPGANYLEFRDLNVTLDELPGKRLLIVVAAAGTNLGRIRFEMKRAKQFVEGAA